MNRFMIKKAKRNILLTLLLLVLFTPMATAGISGSLHDFSTKVWSDGYRCKVCHTPHHGDSSHDYGPLWNHTTTTQTYTVYSSPTLEQTIGQPGDVSKLCLSCHDGTVAIDSYGGNSGSNYMTGPVAVGRNHDLSDDHPIGFQWTHQTGSCLNQSCHFGNSSGDPYSYTLRFYARPGLGTAWIECSTCHDPHNSGLGNPMLRMSNVQSALCLLCHNDK